MFSARGVKREGKDADVQSLTKIAKLHPTESCQSAGQEEMRQAGEDVENAHPECQTFFRAVEALLPQVAVRTSVECEWWRFPRPVWQKDPPELIGDRLPVCGGGCHMKAVGGAADLHSCQDEAHRLEEWVDAGTSESRRAYRTLDNSRSDDDRCDQVTGDDILNVVVLVVARVVSHTCV